MRKKPGKRPHRPSPVGIGILRIPSDTSAAYSVARCGRYPVTPNHSVMMKCFVCDCDVFAQPQVIDGMRESSSVQAFVCNVCADLDDIGDRIASKFHLFEGA